MHILILYKMYNTCMHKHYIACLAVFLIDEFCFLQRIVNFKILVESTDSQCEQEHIKVQYNIACIPLPCMQNM